MGVWFSARRGRPAARAGASLGLLLVIAIAAGAAEAPAPLSLVTGSNRSSDACSGIRFEILEEALQRRLGIVFRCEALPWERAQQLVRTGARDGMVTLYTPERAAYAVATQRPVVCLRNVAYASAQHPELGRLRAARSLDDLARYRFVTYIGNGWARSHLAPRGIGVEYVVDMSSVLAMVAKRRADLLVDDDLDTPRQIRALGLERDIVMLPLELGRVELRLLLNRGSPHAGILPQVDRVLAEMDADGTAARIRARGEQGQGKPEHDAGT